MKRPNTILVPNAPHYKGVYPKQMAFGHQTVSLTSAHYKDGRRGVDGDFQHWKDTLKKQKYSLGTFVIGDADGQAYQGFDEKYWAHHLGIRQIDFDRFGLPNINKWINKHSVGYEIDCLGPLVPAPEGKDLYWSADPDYQKSRWIGRIRVPEKNVVFYPDGFRGFHFFEKYTPRQVIEAGNWFGYLCDKFAIPTDYKEDQWDLSERALKAMPGIWQHVSVRPDKSDCHPQPELIEMLKGLSPKKTIVVKPPPLPLPEKPVVFTDEHFDALEKKKQLLRPLRGINSAKK